MILPVPVVCAWFVVMLDVILEIALDDVMVLEICFDEVVDDETAQFEEMNPLTSGR